MARATLRTSFVDNVRETVRLLRDPALFLWAAYLVTFPIYVFDSGLPQPGDLIIIPLAPLAFARWNGKLPRTTALTVRSLIRFTGYVMATNLIWSVVLGAWSLSVKTGFGLSLMFYVYNALVFLVVLVLHRLHGARLLSFTKNLVLATLVSQVAIAFLVVPSGKRASLLFNSPNQLGYYALLSVSLLIILQRRRYASTIEVTLGTVAATYLALLSASKAALSGILLLALASVVTRLRTLLLSAAVLGVLLIVADPMIEAMTGAISRIETDEHESFAEERGYDRIIGNPEYWVLGAGEGAYVRFADTTVIGSHEIHSSIGTLFFSYGVVGTIVFAMFVWMVMRRTGFKMWLLVAPSFAYGMTHQGLRFTLFWVLLAIVVVMREDDISAAAQRSVEARPR